MNTDDIIIFGATVLTFCSFAFNSYAIKKMNKQHSMIRDLYKSIVIQSVALKIVLAEKYKTETDENTLLDKALQEHIVTIKKQDKTKYLRIAHNLLERERNKI